VEGPILVQQISIRCGWNIASIWQGSVPGHGKGSDVLDGFLRRWTSLQTDDIHVQSNSACWGSDKDMPKLIVGQLTIVGHIIESDSGTCPVGSYNFFPLVQLLLLDRSRIYCSRIVH
jgi:hypothetical protein